MVLVWVVPINGFKGVTLGTAQTDVVCARRQKYVASTRLRTLAGVLLVNRTEAIKHKVDPTMLTNDQQLRSNTS